MTDAPKLDRSRIWKRLWKTLCSPDDCSDNLAEPRAKNILLAGPWGSGKTTILHELRKNNQQDLRTLLDILAEPRLKSLGRRSYIRRFLLRPWRFSFAPQASTIHRTSRKFYLIEFSAWSASCEADPRVAFLKLLSFHAKELDPWGGKTLDDELREVLDCFQKLPKESKAFESFAKLSATALAAGDPLAGSFVLMLTKLTFLLHEQSKHAKAQAKEQLPEAQKLRATMKKLIKAITQLAHCDQCLLVVEDLDRVRPDYAVALLEALYHLFLPWPHDNQADADLPLSSIWAVNMNMLEEYLYEHYRHQPSFDPTAYLTKIFHTRVNVPPLFLRDGPDDASPTCLWRETLGRVQKKQGLGAEVFDNTKPERLADQFSRELNYAFMGNLRLHEAIRNKCLAYWSHDHSDCPPSRECRSNRILWDRVAQPQRFHEARLLTLVEAFPGFRETVVLPTGMWPEFVNRLNSRRQQVQLETTANPIYRHIDDPSLITLLLDLKVLVYDQHADRYRPNHEQCVCLRQDLMQLLDHGF